MLERAYLDHNASVPMSESVRAVVAAALSMPGNPSSVHSEGRAARQVVEEARRSVAALVGANPGNVVFTSGATEAATTLLTPDWRMGRGELRMSRLYVCATDHPCILGGGRFGPAQMEIIGVDSNGMLDQQALGEALDRHDRSEGLPLVAIHAANNESGVVQPFAAIAGMVKAAGGVLVLDAVQAVGRVELDMTGSCGDYLVLSSHKIGGPKGAGAMVAVSDLMMPAPLITGGGQEKGHRAGTENLAAIAGFGAAAREARAVLDDPARIEAVRALRDEIEDFLLESDPRIEIYGRGVSRLPNTVFFSLPGMKAETVQIALDLAGIAVSAGSACSSGKVGASHVLKAMGFGDQVSALRLSAGVSTRREEIELFKTVLTGLLARGSGREKSVA